MTGRGFDSVLVANRGEIACRVIRTLRAMGITSVAVFSDADAGSPHVREADLAVRIGPAPSALSYLAIDRIIDAANAVQAGALHPGYGFLAESAELAERCAQAGIVFIGPRPDAIRRMGSKILSKSLMEAAGVPVIPGFAVEGLAETEVAARARALRYPVLVKASAGGGGKGMRIVRSEAELPAALAAARREAASAFGDDALLVERYFEAPRHVEIQIFGDEHGQLVHLFERECSLQRRHQKVIEEAPSPTVDAALRARLCEAAVAAGKAIDYVGAGTVEFVVDASGEFYFLEVNTRLQVEHPVTEAVTGLDLVRWQIDVARGLPLPASEGDLPLSGHAIEARLYAEDPARDFLPSTGRVALWEVPALPGLRVDSGVIAGSEVGVHYDPLLAKVIAHGKTREEARQLLVRGLRRLAVGGLTTNRDFLVSLLEHDAFAANEIDTHAIERLGLARAHGTDPAVVRLHAVAATLALSAQRRAAGGPLPAGLLPGWRNNRWRPNEQVLLRGDERLEVFYTAEPDGRFALEIDGVSLGVRELELDRESGRLAFELDGVRRQFRVARNGERIAVHGADAGSDFAIVPRFPPAQTERLAGGCVAPMTGVVRKVCVEPGERVEEGTCLVVLEAMKMEHALLAHTAGKVAAVRVEEGQMVDPDDVLVVVEPET